MYIKFEEVKQDALELSIIFITVFEGLIKKKHSVMFLILYHQDMFQLRWQLHVVILPHDKSPVTQ